MSRVVVPFILLLAWSAQAEEATGQKFAVVVGVNEYGHASLTPLDYAENDAEEMAKELRRAGFTVTVLTTRRGRTDTDLGPTTANLRKALEGMLAGRARGDTVLVALAGHGMQVEVDDPDGKGPTRTHPFFCPSDADLIRVSYSTGVAPRLLNLNTLFSQLSRCGAGTKLVMVDACRNVVKGEAATRSIDLDSVTVPRGVGAMFSCGPKQVAYEAADLGGKGHGVFFHFVLEGLRGKAVDDEGAVTWSSLGGYVSRQVTREVPKILGSSKAKQTPHLVSNILGEPPVLVSRRTAPVPRIKSKDEEAEEAYRLGVAYSTGKGKALDLEFAVRHLTEAAEGGHARAQNALGEMLERGKGVRRNLEHAAGWYRKAAAQGEPNAAYNLGFLYEIGAGVEKNQSEARRWYEKASKLGHTRATAKLRVVGTGGGEGGSGSLKTDAPNMIGD